MWALILLFAILLPILLFSILISTIAFAIVLLRRRTAAESIHFSAVAFAYASLMMLVGLFLTVSGTAILINAFVGTAISHDFAFDAHTAANDVVVAGAVLVFVGAIMLVPHATGVALLSQRGVRGATPVLRGFNLIALATATIGFLASGGTALAYVLQKITDEDGAGWSEYHPGEPLAYALILFPAVCWFAYQLWADVTRDAANEDAPAANA